MSACHETLKSGVRLPNKKVIPALNPKNGPFDNSVLKSLHFKTLCVTPACTIPDRHVIVEGAIDIY